MPADQLSPNDIFAEALRRQGAERANYLDEVLAHDPAARQRMERLLRAHADAGSFLESPAADAIDPPPRSGEGRGEGTMDFAPLPERPGTVIGPYKLLQQIGEGGMGVVFMAEQTHPVQRTVALKIIKPGMDTRQVIARFEAERQAVAMMDHPNIARILDAGTTGAGSTELGAGSPDEFLLHAPRSPLPATSGRPYFVMDLVKGVPITGYCDQQHLPIRARLELVSAICQAVQHAHQKGIIHRDLKPSNVLVAEYDGRPVPKIIDFGVAKATAQRLTEKTMFTELGQMIGTVEYMSPEQARFNQLDVDTRSDIYSLGVLLYEILAGSTPFGRKRLNEAAFDEMLRIIREEEPPKPSTRLSSSDALPSIAANRGLEPLKLNRLVQGELDWIVMKCLEKDRNRRYETASSLAEDLQRYLTDQPVEARPATRAYRLKKFVRRNYALLMSVAAIFLVAILGLAASTYLVAQERDEARDAAERARVAADQADRERQRAETNLRTARAAVDKLFTNVAQELGNKPHMEQIRRRFLEDALEFYQGFLKQKSNDPKIRRDTALAYYRVGLIQETLGDGQHSEEALRQSVAILDKLAAEFPAVLAYREDLAWSRAKLGIRLGWANKLDEAIELRRLHVTEYEKLVAEFPTVPLYQGNLAIAHTGLAAPWPTSDFG